MKLIIKILLWSAIAGTLLFTALFALSLSLQDNVIKIFLSSINSNILTKIDIGSYKLSLIRKFPRASVQLENVLVFSSPGLDRNQFRGINTDTLLFAKSVSLEFSMTDLINGKYNIESLNIKRGRLNLYSDSSGIVNYEITGKRTGGPDREITIDLERINIAELKAKYINTATAFYIDGLIRNGRFKSRIAGNNIDFICTSALQICNFKLDSADLSPNVDASIDLNLHKSDSGILFKKSSMKIENFNFSLSGFIRADNRLDLNITGRNIDIARIKNYLPEKYNTTLREYNPSGILKTECRIIGRLSRTSNPNIILTYSLEKGYVRYRKSEIRIKDLSFSGRYTNGKLNNAETSSFELTDINVSLGSASFSGSFLAENFKHPTINMTFTGDIIPEELLEFISLPGISHAKGSLRLNMKLSGILKTKDKYKLSDFVDLNPEADIRFRSFSIGLINKKLSIDDVDGNIMFARNLWAEDLTFSLNGQRFKVNGEFENFPAWISGKPVHIKAIADVVVGALKPESLIADSRPAGTTGKTPYNLPSGIDMQIKFKIDSVVYKTFAASYISGFLNYKPGIINVKSLKLNSLGGNIAGEWILVQHPEKTFTGYGDFTLENVNVNLAFRSFKNFGQDFIKAENLAGSLSGSLSLSLPFDARLNPNVRSLSAEGKYILVNGTLINFAPVRELSNFIELSELENISFSKLENDLFIKDNYLAIPVMNIKSSAADFTVSGKHDFDNNYEYHVKTYLSELLSRKAKKVKKSNTEFGTIEEDGLGRTSLFLKITGKGESVKVTYDLKAVGANIRQNLKNEKSNIKSILKEEYGLFKNDTTVKQKVTPKPKFRIEWSETDTTAIRKDS